MTGWRVYHDLRQRGVRLRIREDRIQANPAGILTPEDLESLHVHRDEILSILDGEEIGTRVADAVMAGHEPPRPLTRMGREEARQWLTGLRDAPRGEEGGSVPSHSPEQVVGVDA